MYKRFLLEGVLFLRAFFPVSILQIASDKQGLCSKQTVVIKKYLI